jgi:hypothetical protein
MEDRTVRLTLRFSLAILATLAAVPASATDDWSYTGSEAVESTAAVESAESAEAADLCSRGWCPLWTVRAGMVYLHRSQPESPLGLLTITNSGDVPNFDWAGGPDVSVIRHMGNGDSLEVRYFGAYNFQIDDEVELGPVDLASAYDSRIHSTEINWRRPTGGRITWLAGFRWIELHEQLDLSQDVIILALDESVNVDNHMYGGQVGADINLLCGCGPWSLDAVLKAGVFADVADADRSIAINGGTIFADRVDDTDAAFLGEIGIVAAYDLNDCWALRGGYQLLWINGAALASEQIEPEINLSGDLFYHGALLGLERTW